MLDAIARQFVQGVLACDNSTKQWLGQRVAERLGLEAGPAGRDGGIDGGVEHNGQRVGFQCKLQSDNVGEPAAKQFCYELDRRGMHIAVYLAGKGYTQGFQDVAREWESRAGADGGPRRFFALTLEDLFGDSELLRSAAEFLPPLAQLRRVLLERPA